MGLQRLQLHNFKSYAGDTVLDLDGTSFVSVVGPNGSGKSNLLDAVCFVLGMAPAQLRCTRLTELCHSGSSKMFVEATIDIYGHVQVFRRTPSTYLVDGQRVSSAEYEQRWSRLNVFPQLMNTVVLQGDIEKLAGAAPSQLATLVESLEAVESTQTESDFADLRREYETAREALNKARAAAHAHSSERDNAQDAVDEFRQLRSARALHDKLTAELNEVRDQRTTLMERARRAKLADLKRKLAEARTRVEEARSEARLVTHDNRTLRSDYARRRRAMQSARAQETEARNLLSQTESQQTPLTHKIAALEAEQRVLAPELSLASESLKAAEVELEGAERALHLLARAEDQARNEDERAIGVAPELRQLWNDLENKFSESHSTELENVADAQHRVDASGLAVESLEVAIQAHSDARDAAETRVREFEARVAQAEAHVDEHEARTASFRSQLEQVTNELAEVRSEISDLQPRLVANTEKLQRAGGNKAVHEKRRRLVDSVDRMKRSLPGVLDLLGDLVIPSESQFQASLERALGPLADAVVVDSGETAIKCAKLVREQRLGAFTFMPVSDLEVSGVDAVLRARLRTSGVEGARLLIDSISVDSAARPAAAYALGSSVVVPDMDAALRLRDLGFSVRLITLDGSVLSPNNLMSVMPGMASTAASDRAIAALSRKTAQLVERLKAASAREPDLVDHEAELLSRIDAGIKAQEAAKRDATIALEQLASARREADHLAEPIDAESQKPTALSKLEADEAELQAYKRALSASKAEFFSPFLAEAGGTLADWEPVFDHSTTRQAELDRERATLNDRLESSKRRHHTARDVVRDIERREKVLASARQAAVTELEELEKATRAATAKLERAVARMRELKAEAESKSDEVGQAEVAMDEANERLEQAEQNEKRAAAELDAERLAERLRKKARLNADGSADVESAREDDQATNESSSPNTQVDGEESDSEAESEDESEGELEDESEDADGDVSMADAASTTVLSVQQLEDRIREIEAELSTLNVSEDFEAYLSQAAERYSQLNEEAAAHRDDSDELRERLELLRGRRAAKFDTALDELQGSLNEVYAELVGVNAQAVLTPVNPDEPFEGVEFAIMAPGKPFAPVTQLSGGERSMAALALLFACQRLRPAPFVVLDEVDAALDFMNVANVAQFIRNHSKATQYIVVSLKQRLYQRAGHLVGVYKHELKSRLLTVAL